MERIDKEGMLLLLQLLSGRGCASTLLLDFLRKEEIVALLSCSRQIRTSIANNLHATNRLYYEAAVQCDKSMLSSVYYSEEVQRYEQRRLTALNEQERLDWAPQLRRLNVLLSSLHNNLSRFILSEEASTVLQDVRRVLREPDLPLPQLRHQSVGTYCNSPFQVLLAQLDEPASSLLDEWQPQAYLPLKKKLFELGENFKQEFDSCEPFLLKNIRYRVETLPTYQSTPSTLVNIVQLLVLLIGNHLDGLVAYFSALSGTEVSETGLTASTTSTATNLTCSLNKNSMTASNNDSFVSSVGDCPVEFLLEFTTSHLIRGIQFVQRQQKLGFLFKHFVMVFELCYPEYSMHPSFSLWRIMQKLWISRMGKFHMLTNVLYTEQFLRQVEGATQTLLNQEEAESGLLNNRIKCLYFSQRKLPSQLHLEKYFGPSPATARNIYLEADGDCEQQTFNDYTEYLVDVSINEYNVNWCGSTQQRLGAEFRQADKQLVLAMNNFLTECQYVLGSACITKLIFEAVAEHLSERLKAPTQATIFKHAADYLEELRVVRLKELQSGKPIGSPQQLQLELEILKEWRLCLPDLNKRDRIVQCFARERAISQQTGEQYCFLFDLDKPVKLQQLQSMMREHSDLDSQPQMQLVESYISNDNDSQHHDLDQPPKLALGRIQSMT